MFSLLQFHSPQRPCPLQHALFPSDASAHVGEEDRCTKAIISHGARPPRLSSGPLRQFSVRHHVLLLLFNPRFWQGCVPKTQRGTGLLGFRTLEAACLDCVPVPLRLQLRLLLLPPERAQHRSFSKPVAALSEVSSSSHWRYPAQIPLTSPGKFIINSLGPYILFI